MRATEIIRGVLDLIDQVECATHPTEELPQDPIGGAFAQIFAKLAAEQPPQDPPIYTNSPDTHVQGIEAVTTAAGLGTLGASSPSDIRTNAPSLYPNYGAK